MAGRGTSSNAAMGAAIKKQQDAKKASEQAASVDAYKQSEEAKIEAMRKQMVTDLYEASQGRGESIALKQAAAGKEQNLQSALAFAASQRGANAGLTQRNAQLAQQQGAMNIDQQAQIARLQEIQDARAAFLGDLSGRYAADRNYAIQQQQLAAQKSIAETQANASLWGSLIGAAGSGAALYAMSDENVKEDVKDGSGKIKSFLDAIAAHDYKYKPETGEDAKRHVSPMAQELEQTEVGRGMVEDTPGGKVVNYGKGFGVILAAQAELNDRLKKLEAKKNG